MSPDWKQELDSKLRAAYVAAKRNPGASMVYTGKHWEDVSKLLKEVLRLSEVADNLQESANQARLMVGNSPEALFISRVLREGLETYEQGKTSEEVK